MCDGRIYEKKSGQRICDEDVCKCQYWDGKKYVLLEKPKKKIFNPPEKIFVSFGEFTKNDPLSEEIYDATMYRTNLCAKRNIFDGDLATGVGYVLANKNNTRNERIKTKKGYVKVGDVVNISSSPNMNYTVIGINTYYEALWLVYNKHTKYDCGFTIKKSSISRIVKVK